MNSRRLTPADLWLLLAALLPAVTTYFAFVHPVTRQVTYPLGKGLTLAFPLLWAWHSGYLRQGLGAKWGLRPKRGDVLPGLLSGLLIGGGIVMLYVLLLRGRLSAAGIISAVPPLMLKYYWLTAFAMSLGNSLVEEYFFRAFLWGELAERFRPGTAIGLGGLIFGLHHLVLLVVYFALGPALLFTVGTMIGGWLWSGMRARGNSIWACYASHLLADLAILGVGYTIIFR